MVLIPVILCTMVMGSSAQSSAAGIRSLYVSATQGLHFGTFATTGSTGGSVTVNYDGQRTATGNVQLLAISPIAHPAIFEIKICQGRNVTLTFSPVTRLVNKEGSVLQLEIGSTDLGDNHTVFSVSQDCSVITTVHVGGTLHIPGTVLAGTYSGSFEITFNQE